MDKYVPRRRNFLKAGAVGLSALAAKNITDMLLGRFGGSNYKARSVYQRSRASYKKRTPYRKYRRSYRKRDSKACKAIKKDLTKLKKRVDASLSTYIKKTRTVNACIATAGLCNYSSFAMNNVSNLQDVIDAVKYFDPSAPSTLINVDLSAPTFQNQVLFQTSYGKVMARNNYVVPVVVRIYWIEVRKDTSIAGETAISNSLSDMSNATISSPLVYPSDCHDFNDLWKISKSSVQELSPGQSCSLSWSCKPFSYDVSLSDSHTSSFQTYFHGSQCMVRVEGVPAHGSTSGVSQVGCGVDIHFERKHVVTYPGGTDVKFLEIDDNLDTIVGTLQVTQYDTAQEAYSL